MKNLIYLGIGGLVIYLFLQNRKKVMQTKINPRQRIIEAGNKMEQTIENTQFTIPDTSDRKMYEQEQKLCK